MNPNIFFSTLINALMICKKKHLLLHDIVPSRAHKVPGYWSTNHVAAYSRDDAGSVLFTYFTICNGILQKPATQNQVITYAYTMPDPEYIGWLCGLSSR